MTLRITAVFVCDLCGTVQVEHTDDAFYYMGYSYSYRNGWRIAHEISKVPVDIRDLCPECVLAFRDECEKKDFERKNKEKK